MNILGNRYTKYLFAEADDTPPAGGGAPGTGDTPPPANDGEPPEGDDTDFSFESEETDDDDAGKKDEKENPDNAEFNLELPDDFEASDEFKALASEHAKAAGLDGKAAGKYVAGVVGAIQALEAKELAESSKQLKADWGKDFEGNMKEVKRFASALQSKAGLTSDDLAVLQSPKGYRLLHALSKSVGEGDFVKGKQEAVSDPVTEANRMLTDPTHPDHEAISNPNHPRFREANQKYNKLVGLPG